MAYLIAINRKRHGCFALKIKHGKHLVELKRRLNKVVGYKGIELITISRPNTYVILATSQFVDPPQEFEEIVRDLDLIGERGEC